ncbi:DeoR/GlpR family DNA-binding transcription regulator [Nakamurella leprariae]|uniref:DeoR/GlpR transcriptional regulator n=1 Tax=Nakamurella leprariae TaxID=2803911 RepID=A0A938YI72_9ACTN|nr:DeoR/GlpR family DNA-binding transcription regulator [Nakamurella leprariae]MBM9468260.1 DeoR/GlpR transcriptional regulator [Nakamurella leprariae]
MASLDELAREQAVLAALRSSGRVSIQELAGKFGVSAVTVRKDLDALARRQLLRRVRGGAVSVGATDEGSFDGRLRQAVAAKAAIARAAARLVRDGDVIAMDASTTCYHLARELLHRRDLVVVTNGLRAATLLMAKSDATVMMPGGILRRSSGSLIAPVGDVLTGRGRIRLGFFGVVGLSTSRGLLDISAGEAQTKQHLVNACDEVHGVFDSSKADGFGLHTFAGPGQITGLWTDEGLDPAVTATWAAVGVPVTTVRVDHTLVTPFPLTGEVG